MRVKVRMTANLGGSWPDVGELANVTESQGVDLVASNRAEAVGMFKAKLNKIAEVTE